MRRLLSIVIALAFMLPLALWGPGITPVAADTGSGWTGEYFNNPSLAGTPVFVRLDATIAFNWGAASPMPGIVPPDGFSVRWTGPQTFDGGTYTFTLTVDDGGRVFVDDALVIDAWRDQVATTYTGNANLKAGQHWVRVEYYDAVDQASVSLSWRPANAETAPGGWEAEYYNNPNLQPPQAGGRLENSIDYNWGSGSPLAGINPDNFSVRWWGFPNFEGGTYTFVLGVDDGARVYVDNTLVIDAWTPGAYREVQGTAVITAGVHTVKVEYFELADQARISLYWYLAGSLPPGTSGGGAVPSLTATINTGALNVRSGPGIGNGVVGRVYQGDVVGVTARNADNTWIEVNTGGITGWVSARFVILSGSISNLPVSNGSGGSAVLQAQSSASVRIRRGPGTNHSRIAAFTRGDIATVIGRNADSSWLQIRTANGTEGWVSASFVTLLGGGSLSGIPITG